VARACVLRARAMDTLRMALGLVTVGLATMGLVAGTACSSSSAPIVEPDAAHGGDSSTSDTGTVVADGPDKDTWTNYADAFFMTYCDSCHDGKMPGIAQNFNEYSQVKPLVAEMRCGVAPTLQSGCSATAFPPPTQFPIGDGPKPTDAERLRFVAWVNAGAPEN
jgi:hypothetical protein